MLSRKTTALIVLVVLMLAVGCGGGSPVDTNPNSDNDTNNTGNDTDNNGDDSDSGLPEWLDVEASATLPEPWLAYPGTMIDADWVGFSAYPAWLLVAPPGVTREEVIEYYVTAADEHDDFELVEVYHGITGTWLWKGFELMIETDNWYNDPDLVQITFAFQEDIE